MLVSLEGGTGFLDAWVDFNAAGDWNDPGEPIFVSQEVVEGENLLAFTVPIDASAGVATYSRFRLSRTGGLAPTGDEASGEVEDYLLSFNAAPTIAAPDGQIARERITGVVELGRLVDPGDDGPWTVVVDWGDGTTETLVVDEAGPIDAQSHRYLSAGTFQVTVSATDDAGVGGPSSSFQIVVAPTPATPGDMDRDGLTDLVDYTSNVGSGVRFEMRHSSDGGAFAVPLGEAGDIPVHGDFDGDGIIDVAVFRPNVDSNGDGMADAAGWTIIKSSTGNTREVLFGAPGIMALPVPADYDGDGKADIATFRPDSDLTPGAAHWFILPSSTNLGYAKAMGVAGNLAAPGDYDADGRCTAGQRPGVRSRRRPPLVRRRAEHSQFAVQSFPAHPACRSRL